MPKARERLLTRSRIRRKRGHYKRESRFAVGILDAFMLSVQDLPPRRHLANREFERDVDFIYLRQRQAGDPIGATPDGLQPLEPGRGERNVSECREPCSLRTGRSGAVKAGASAERSEGILERARALPDDE